jgi:hypothetical protein
MPSFAFFLTLFISVGGLVLTSSSLFLLYKIKNNVFTGIIFYDMMPSASPQHGWVYKVIDAAAIGG